MREIAMVAFQLGDGMELSYGGCFLDVTGLLRTAQAGEFSSQTEDADSSGDSIEQYSLSARYGLSSKIQGVFSRNEPGCQ